MFFAISDICYNGISVSAIIIAAGGGFSGTSSSIINPPTEDDFWADGMLEKDSGIHHNQ
jgi:hypothetical protein